MTGGGQRVSELHRRLSLFWGRMAPECKAIRPDKAGEQIRRRGVGIAGDG